MKQAVRSARPPSGKGIMLALLLAVGAVTAGPDGAGLISSGFVFEPSAEYKSNHGSSVASMPDGSILCAWYSGTAEANPDVAIYASRFQAGKWSRPEVIADTPDKPEGNPVLFVDAKGRTWLFFVTIHGLGWNWAKIKYRTSEDSGHTWGPVTMFRDKRGWMTRNHPIILKDGRILLPLYSENKWCSEFMASVDNGATWEHLSEVCSKPGNIQAAVAELGDGSLYATMRTGARKGTGRLWRTRSSDGGRTWSAPELTALPNPNAGTDMIRLASGRLLLAFNNSADKRTPLSLAVSDDNGNSWRVVRDVETAPGEYSYPSLCQAGDGVIHLTYTYRRETIKHLAFTELWIK
ncbi:MAG TPA: sialidase family protein [bacterium]|nr:sialidase family protein [bacterium]